MNSSEQEIPVVEPIPEGGEESLTLRALNARVRQQEILADLGVLALQGADFETLLDVTARMTAEGLGAEYCKVLQFRPSSNDFLVRAGVGWGADVVGKATVGADLESPAGFALRSGKPVISNHLENEERFRTPELLARHGIRRAMNVILQGDGTPFGVLEVDSNSENEFVENDLAFLQGAANLLGMAIERQRDQARLEAALERHKILLKELNHRVKNSLHLVISMLRLQAGAATGHQASAQFEEASRQVAAIAVAHEHLYQGDDIETLDLAKYLADLWPSGAVGAFQVSVEATEGVRIATDKAIPLALVVNELVTNAAKYAYAAHTTGTVWVGVAHSGENHIRVSVRDEGAGVPQGFDPAKSRGLGMRIVTALTRQLDATLTVDRRNPGVEFALLVPLEPSS